MSRGSLGLDPCKLDHLGPLFGFIGNELAEVGGRTSACVALGCRMWPALMIGWHWWQVALQMC